MLAFSVWEAIWVVFVSFVFISVLIMIFSIVADIFRDDQLSGWAKAAWLFFLVVFTLLTALVYVVVRGDGMAKRSARQQVEAKQSFDAYVREAAGGGAATELERAAAMHEAGKISDEEYARLKAKILG
jgi:hypothetical protein